MRVRASRLVALGFGSGLSPVAPGTVGSLAAWAVYELVTPPLTNNGWLIALPLLFLLGVWACDRTGEALGVADHGGMVWDEMVAVWLVLAWLPASFGWHLAGVALFRFFDIVKPPPIRYFDRRLKNGFGVMFDDLLAAFLTLLVLALWKS